MRHIISLKEQTKSDILEMLDLAKRLKRKRNKNEPTEYLKNKTLIMLFEKTSTRTRLSFEAAMTELGGHAIYLDARSSQLALTDFGYEIQAIMRYGHILMYRARQAAHVIQAASYDSIPVVDACSEKYHPAQALSDLLTMDEHPGGIGRVKKIAWLGIENNVCNTLVAAATKLGIEVAIAAPEKDRASLDPELSAQAEAAGLVKRSLDLGEVLDRADYVHTDSWMNMEYFQDGEIKWECKEEYERRNKKFLPYQLNAGIIDQYAPRAGIMHCMPCHLGHEITRDAVEHPNSVIFDQAENRLHMQKAMLMWLLNTKPK